MGYYEIAVENHINPKRFKEYVELEVIHLPEGNSVICVWVKDQAELYSILRIIFDMNLMLLSVLKK